MTATLSSDSITVIIREGSRGGAVTSAYNARSEPDATHCPRLSPPRHSATRRTPSPPPCIAFLRPSVSFPACKVAALTSRPSRPSHPTKNDNFQALLTAGTGVAMRLSGMEFVPPHPRSALFCRIARNGSRRPHPRTAHPATQFFLLGPMDIQCGSVGRKKGAATRRVRCERRRPNREAWAQW